MSAPLKNGWAPCRLGDVLTLVNGRAYKQPEMLQKGTPILRIQNLNGGNNWFYSDLALPGDKYCIDGDLLYAWSATFGPYIYQGPKAIFHYHIWNVHPSFAVEKQFAFYELIRITDGIKQAAHGVAMPHITKAGMEDWDLNLPPLPEQKRIADKLDSVLARVDACRDRLDRLPALLKRFRQSILTAATSGRLTEDWRGVNTRATATEYIYESVLLDSLIANGPQNGLYKHSSAYGSGTGILRIDMFYDGEVTGWDAMKLLELTKAELETYGLSVGDIVVNRVNSPPYVGKAALIRELPQPCVFESNMMRIRLDKNRILPEYCIRFLSSLDGLLQLRRNVKHAVNQASINQTDVKSVEIPLPSIAEQTEIVRRVEILLAFADRLEARLATARRQVGQLTPALLAKAFRGELVAQDPADEPAAELLKRLAAQRAAAPVGKRARTGAPGTR